MKKINRIILWTALVTTGVVLALIKLPLRLSNTARGEPAADVILAISLFAAYLILVIGVMVVGANAYQNMTLRRADATLQTRENRWYFNAAVAFCVVALSSIFLPIL